MMTSEDTELVQAAAALLLFIDVSCDACLLHLKHTRQLLKTQSG